MVTDRLHHTKPGRGRSRHTRPTTLAEELGVHPNAVHKWANSIVMIPQEFFSYKGFAWKMIE